MCHWVFFIFLFLPSQVVGVEGIMSAYSCALTNVALAGPTLFSHVVDKAAHIASQSLSQNSPKYFVLLIITVRDWKHFLRDYFWRIVSFWCQKLIGWLETGWSLDRHGWYNRCIGESFWSPIVGSYRRCGKHRLRTNGGRFCCFLSIVKTFYICYILVKI